MGQLGAAPPAMDGVVPAEIVGLRKDRLSQTSQRKPAVSVPIVTLPCVVQLIIEGAFVQARNGGRGAMGQSIQQLTHLPIAEGSAITRLLVPGKQVVWMHVARGQQLQHPHFRRAEPGGARRKLFEQCDDGVA